ncbi:MAG TPA: glycosyltransferase [Tianweitania sediminis]|jgi:glycosyltransferase involved in cell wall biosynthesis|nr:glycosyltransferase [Tianweitania sediminis]
MRVAIVHDWLYVIGGAERVLQQILTLFPEAEVYTVFEKLNDEGRQRIGLSKPVHTTFLQKFPGVNRIHRTLLPLMPIAIEQLDLSPYDLVISSSYAVAKGVLTGPDQIHISYVHSPIRYAWDLQHRYLAETGSARGPKGMLMRLLLHWIRIWDVRTGHGPDVMIANSKFIARRIRKVYGRTAQVIYPPVDLSTRLEPFFKGDYFLTASRLVAYKNIEVVVRAFALLPNLKLVVAGSGPQADHLRKIATPNVEFAGYVSDAKLRELMAGARSFIFAAEEDFGIISVEAQSEGTPVLALRRGGSKETVVDGLTGLFFDEATPEAIAATVSTFTARETQFSPEDCVENAKRFSAERFRSEFQATVDTALLSRKNEDRPRRIDARSDVVEKAGIH